MLPARFAMCRLSADSPLPEWCDTLPFCSISRTADELSIICVQDSVPADVNADREWRAFKLRGPFPLNAVGILVQLAQPLADHGVSMMAVSTYDTDYLLVKEHAFAVAVLSFQAAGQTFPQRDIREHDTI